MKKNKKEIIGAILGIVVVIVAFCYYYVENKMHSIDDVQTIIRAEKTTACFWNHTKKLGCGINLKEKDFLKIKELLMKSKENKKLDSNMKHEYSHSVNVETEENKFTINILWYGGDDFCIRKIDNGSLSLYLTRQQKGNVNFRNSELGKFFEELKNKYVIKDYTQQSAN